MDGEWPEIYQTILTERRSMSASENCRACKMAYPTPVSNFKAMPRANDPSSPSIDDDRFQRSLAILLHTKEIGALGEHAEVQIKC